ncbi:MAG: aminopeptidase [Acidobacteria bacterium]|nr:aminopeptidase [Acidobacteriota bacterium]
MSRKWYLLFACGLCLPAAWWVAQRMSVRILPVTEGISRTLATARADGISSVRYALELSIPERTQDPIAGAVTIRLNLAYTTPVVLDFAQPATAVSSVAVNGRPVPVRSEHGHLVIAADALSPGENTVEIAFTAGNDALNRNDEYLYSLFVPARASHAFPCFDQPDIKASIALSLEVPAGWVAVANAPEIGRETTGGRTRIRFGQTQALPTYLFGFAAGRFSVERGERNGRPFHLYHRETDAAKVAANLTTIFDLHQQSIDWLETYTNRKYPFDKLDFVLLPTFQFTGMEHAGAIYYGASAMLLDKTATQEQHLSRASLIAHETAHMWFGDLVTMKWFDDVWLKEVFANFMADKIVNPSFPDIDHELRFLLLHYSSAYDVDRSAGANPIRQPLDNLKDAGSLYGPIIYDKAPIVMRQLEALLGPDELRDGLREYLTRYAFANATWADLIAILDRRTDEDLGKWSRLWVDEPGRPTIATDLRIESGKVSRLALSQSDPAGRSRLWDQQLQVALGYEHGARVTPLRMNAPAVELAGARDLPVPRYVLPNGEGTGYGLFKPDPATRAFLVNHLPEIGDAVTRGTAWLTLWDDMLEGGTAPADFLELAFRALPLEREEQNVERVLGYSSETYWRFLSDPQRAAVSNRLEQALLSGMNRAQATSLKSAYFAAFRRTVTSRDGLAYLERIWRQHESIPGLRFAEVDYISMAEALALRPIAAADAILEDQAGRITNPDRRARFAFVTPALSSEAATRDAFFSSLARAEQRAHEPWVVDALRFLNHPLRRDHAERYIAPALDLLAEIQRTGDIFFPSRWTSAVLGGHNSTAAADTVTAFLARRRDYPPRLRQIIEQSSDQLLRAARSGNSRPGSAAP